MPGQGLAVVCVEGSRRDVGTASHRGFAGRFGGNAGSSGGWPLLFEAAVGEASGKRLLLGGAGVPARDFAFSDG